VDAKWVFGLLLTGLLTVLLVLATLWQVTRRETAVTLFVEAGMSMLYPAPQATHSLDEALARARKNPDSLVRVMGLEVPLRGHEIAGLDRDAAARLVFRRLGEVFYDKGPEGLAHLRISNTPSFLGQQGPGPLALLNSRGHSRVGVVVAVVAMLALLLLIPVVYFSAGWGRLGSPGVCLFVASLPGLPLVAVGLSSSSGNGPSPVLRFLGQAVAPVYGLAAAGGLALIAFAILGHFASRLGGKWTAGRL
jgi:hypothetical protein